MMTTGWHPPNTPQRTSVVVAHAMGLAAVITVAMVARIELPVSVWYPVKAAVVAAVVMSVAFGFVRNHHPFSRFGPANQTTMARAVLVSLVAALIGEPRLPAIAASAASITLVAAVLDSFDGWLARRSGMPSEFGARFDMEIDALLVMVVSTLAWQFGKAGSWVLLSGLLRYLFVAGGWLWPWLKHPLPPRVRRQTICAVQVVGLGLTVGPITTTRWSRPLAAAALAALASSFLIDIVWLRRQADQDVRQSNSTEPLS